MLAWASIAAWAAGCVPLVLGLAAEDTGARDEIAAGIGAIVLLVLVAHLAVGALIGFILARLAERRIPDDDLAMIAYAIIS